MQNCSAASVLGMILRCARRLAMGTGIAVVAVHLSATGVAAQSAPRSGTGTGQARTAGVQRPDFSGVWMRLRSPHQISNSDMFHPDVPPMTPWAQERFRVVRKGISNPLQQAREDIDPILEPYCMVPGYPRILLRPGAMEIVQTPTALYMLFDNYSQFRTVYMDGRQHAEGIPATFMGHAIGRWDGDTIVAETVALNDLTWLDGIGTPHSTELRVEERLRMIEQNTMKIELRFEDPKAYTRPWTGEKIFELRPEWELMEYVICENSTGEEWWKALLREGGTREPE